MANYNVTVSPVFGGTSITQNVAAGDTVTVTIGGFYSNNWVAQSTTNCSVSPASGTSSQVAVVSTFTDFGYGITFRTTNPLNGQVQTGTVSGTVTQSQPANNSSISTNASQYVAGDTVTVSWSTNQYYTKYYNSTGDVSNGSNRFSPKEGSLGDGSSGSFNVTALSSSTASWTGGFSLRLGSTGGAGSTVIANSNTVTIYSVPSTPSALSVSNLGSTSFTANATAGTNNYGTLQVRLDGGTWRSNGTTFTGLTASTSYTVDARQVNGPAVSGLRTITVTTDEAPPPPPTPPTDITFSAGNDVSATTNVTVTASGGTNGTMQVSANGSTWWDSPATFIAKTRGTTQTWYARTYGTPISSTYSESYTVPYLPTDTDVAGTSSSISSTATSATTTVSGVDRTTEEIAVRVNNGTTNLGTCTGNDTITWSGSLPTAGNATIYELFARRPTNTGGSGVWVATNDTFTVTRLDPVITQPVVNNTQNFDTTTQAATFSHTTSLSSSGSNGTLEYNLTESSDRNINNPSSTLPTTGWTTSASRTLERGYYYHFWARRSAGAGDRTDSALQAPYLPTDLNAEVAPSFEISVNSTSFAIGILNPEPNHAYRFGTNTSYGEITGTGSPYTTGVIDPQGFASITIPSAASHYPSVGSPKRYYLYASRTETSGGSGGTGSFSSPGWYYTGSSVLVTMVEGGGGTPVPGGSGDYGLQIRNASGTVTLDVSDRTTNRVAKGSISVPGNQTPSAPIPFPGMTPTNLDTHVVVLPEIYTGFVYVVNRNTNNFTISTLFNTSTQDVSYVAVRYG